MKTRLLVAALSMACAAFMLAGLSIARSQSGQNANSGQSNANRAAGTKSNSADMKFAMTAAQDGMTEVELGRLAVQKGTSDAVKQFGQKMIDDHTAANQQLTQLATSKGMTLPTTLDPKHAAMVQKFQSLSGAAFDRAYAKQMVQDHRKAVNLFQKEADKGMDADLKAFASQTLPTLQGHLSMAQAMNGSTGSGSGNMNGRTAPSNTAVVVNDNGNMNGGNRNSNRSRNTNSNANSNRNMNSNNSNRK